MGISVFDNDISFDPFFGKKAGISDCYFFIFEVYKNANGKTINSRVTCVVYKMIKK